MKFETFIGVLYIGQTFSQNDYRVIHERFSVDWYNTSYGKNIKYVLFHYTRYQKRFNCSGTLLQDVGHDITETVRAYKFQSNEYREFPVVWNGNMCDTVKFDTFGTSAAHFDSNIGNCPFKKGFYYVYNAYMDESKLPPYAPRGRYMLDFTVFYNKTIILARVKWYGAVEPTNPLERVITF